MDPEIREVQAGVLPPWASAHPVHSMGSLRDVRALAGALSGSSAHRAAVVGVSVFRGKVRWYVWQQKGDRSGLSHLGASAGPVPAGENAPGKAGRARVSSESWELGSAAWMGPPLAYPPTPKASTTAYTEPRELYSRRCPFPEREREARFAFRGGNANVPRPISRSSFGFQGAGGQCTPTSQAARPPRLAGPRTALCDHALRVRSRLWAWAAVPTTKGVARFCPALWLN